jgi:biotin carboxyl carrier protein
MIYRFQSRGEIHEIRLERSPEGYCAQVDGKSYQLEVMDSQPGMISMKFAGRPATIHWAAAEGGQKWVSLKGCTYLLEKPVSASARHSSHRSAENLVRSPMPAQVRAIEVAVGDSVKKGQTLILLEAMKMEIRLQAPQPGRITSLKVEPGQNVNRDQELLEIENL